MAEVVAKERGYFGSVIREPGDRFTVPDDIWNDKNRRPSWASAAKFGGKGDHDDDGKAGGAKASAEKPETAAEKKARLAAEKAKGDVFDDAPEPVRVKNEANEATGQTEPDWVAPKPID